MFDPRLVTGAAAMAALFAAAPAHAVPVTFALSGNGGNLGKTEQFGPQGTITLTTSGFKRVDPDADTLQSTESGGLNDANLHQNSDGLGVDGDNVDSSEGDRLGRKDAIQFSFNADVWLLSAITFEVGTFDERFSLFDANGDRVFANDPDYGKYFQVDGGVQDSDPEFFTLDLSSYAVYGNLFTIVGVTCSDCRQSPNEDNRGIRISSITVTEDMPAVPIPAALPLLVGGLAGMGFVARRKRKPAA